MDRMLILIKPFLLILFFYEGLCVHKSRHTILLDDDGGIFPKGSLVEIEQLNYDKLLEFLGDESLAG